MTMNFHDRINELRISLEQKDEIDLLECTCYPSLEEDDLDALLQASGRRINAVLRDFYRTTNGWRLVWLDRTKETYSESKREWSEVPDNWWRWQGDYFAFDGVIQILPLAELLQTNGRNRWWFPQETGFPVTIGSELTDSLSVKQNLQLFDVFDKFYSSALYWPEAGDPMVLFGRDHEADFYSSQLFEVPAYFDFLFESKGALSAREELMAKLAR